MFILVFDQGWSPLTIILTQETRPRNSLFLLKWRTRLREAIPPLLYVPVGDLEHRMRVKLAYPVQALHRDLQP